MRSQPDTGEQIEPGLTDEDEVPELPEQPVTVLGDVWVLGKHRLMCGDSTSIDAVDKLTAGAVAQLLHADPPYGMGKAAYGVANDNIYEEDLDKFQMEWWATFRTFLADNASAYIWGNSPDLWRLWYRGGLGDSENLALRNQIVWDKKSISGMKSDLMTQFPIASEHCLFFQFGNQFRGNINTEDFPADWEPVQSYLAGDRGRTRPQVLRCHCQTLAGLHRQKATHAETGQTFRGGYKWQLEKEITEKNCTKKANVAQEWWSTPRRRQTRLRAD
jgi:hypothetical protein